MLQGNVTEDATMLQNISSHLKVIDNEMAMVADMVQMQQNSQEQLKENMTALSFDFISFHYSLNDLEARTNASELWEELNKTVAIMQGVIEGGQEAPSNGVNGFCSFLSYYVSV